ncbi:MAG: TolC family protein, partial [Bdellovibrionales bacterium]|nr:TolC family protein [Bdellovibrionales bacterium]
MNKQYLNPILLTIIFLTHSLITNSTPSLNTLNPVEDKVAIKNLKEKLDALIEIDPDLLQQKLNLQISEKKYSQSSYLWVPNLQAYGSQTATNDHKSFSQTQVGLSADINLFQFGRDYFLYKSRKSGFEANKAQLAERFIEVENQYLSLIFENIFLSNKKNYYKEIVKLKHKVLKVAQERYNRGNLAQQQVDKISIDLS